MPGRNQGVTQVPPTCDLTVTWGVMSAHYLRATATLPCTGCGGGGMEHYVLFGFGPAKLGVNKFKLGCDSGMTRV